jgi:hypothetical protein
MSKASPIPADRILKKSIIPKLNLFPNKLRMSTALNASRSGWPDETQNENEGEINYSINYTPNGDID